MLKIINVTFLLLYCSLIFWLSSQPGMAAPKLFMHQDKIFHLAAYFVMGILAWRFFADYFANPTAVIVLSLCFCSLYGLSDEWHQSYVSGRTADTLDWLADTLGASISLILPLTKRSARTEKA